VPWDVLVGDTKIGRLTERGSDPGVERYHFVPAESFDRYAAAFAGNEIWEVDDHALDAVIDEIAVDGLFLVGDDGSEIVDPDLRIDGSEAWIQSNSST
jgi:hypothetical protein